MDKEHLQCQLWNWLNMCTIFFNFKIISFTSANVSVVAVNFGDVYFGSNVYVVKVAVDVHGDTSVVDEDWQIVFSWNRQMNKLQTMSNTKKNPTIQ